MRLLSVDGGVLDAAVNGLPESLARTLATVGAPDGYALAVHHACHASGLAIVVEIPHVSTRVAGVEVRGGGVV